MKPSDYPSLWQSRFPVLFALACAVFFATAAALSVWNSSSTWDDAYHITGGAAQWQTGKPNLNADHPPLGRLLGALPSLFMDIPAVADLDPGAWHRADLINSTNAYFATVEDRLLWPARLTMLVLAGVLAALLYAWGKALLGPGRVWLPLALFAFCPPLLANAALVTTDMAATTFFFAAVYAWWHYLRKPTAKHLLWVGLAVSAALASKHTALLLAPLLIALGGISLNADRVLPYGFGQRLRIVFGGLAAIGAMVLFAINAVYFFDGLFLTPADYVARSQALVPLYGDSAATLSQAWPSWLPIPLPFYYVNGVVNIFGNVGERGHATYFLGQPGFGGWPNYFLMLLLVKLPIPSLLLIGLGISQAVSRLPRDGWNILFLAAPPLLLIGVASTGKMQIGIRHILPALPFLFLLAGYALHGPFPRWRTMAAAALAGLSGISTLAIHPDYLMYFNFLGGGPEQGWRISVTGDDYGQGGAELKRWLQARGVKELAYGPFGWGGVVLNRAGIQTKPPPCQDTGELVAIHAGALLLTYSLENTLCYTWMRLKEPDEKIGYSIFIYNSKNLK